jgi:hypothetical protein
VDEREREREREGGKEGLCEGEEKEERREAPVGHEDPTRSRRRYSRTAGFIFLCLPLSSSLSLFLSVCCVVKQNLPRFQEIVLWFSRFSLFRIFHTDKWMGDFADGNIKCIEMACLIATGKRGCGNGLISWGEKSTGHYDSSHRPKSSAAHHQRAWSSLLRERERKSKRKCERKRIGRGRGRGREREMEGERKKEKERERGRKREKESGRETDAHEVEGGGVECGIVRFGWILTWPPLNQLRSQSGKKLEYEEREKERERGRE